MARSTMTGKSVDGGVGKRLNLKLELCQIKQQESRSEGQHHEFRQACVTLSNVGRE